MLEIQEDNSFWINGIEYPTLSVRNFDVKNAFAVRHVVLAFVNDWELSITWSMGTYSSNHLRITRDFMDPSPDAEIAAWNADRHWYDFTRHGLLLGESFVLGYVTAAEVQIWIERIKTFPRELPFLETNKSYIVEDLPEKDD